MCKRRKLTHKHDNEENNLVKQLREEYCYANGREKNVKESAKIFHKLGLIYKKRSPDKICLIQSAALLNAAITRQPDNVDEIKEDLRKFCSHLLDISGAKNKKADLVKHATLVKLQIEEMRKKANEQLRTFNIIPSDIRGDELLQLEKNQINDVKKLQDAIAEDYKTIMNELSHFCVEVMGDAPCKFTLTGMGSLARKEITPYSDFENIIVLEEGVQKRTDYAEVKEYFKWFAVIFQVILINLEETIIPSVAIPSLNDCTIRNGDWFFDAHTTRGVSFDGMMPFACKSPLGRGRGTKDKPWATELIKPVREMAEYLEKEQDLKNGYHLADILATTCYVSGDRDIYKEFKVAVQQILASHDNEVKDQLKEQIREDLLKFSTQQGLSNPNLGERFNVKRVVYRSTTIFISGLGRMHKIDASSCFDIVSELGKKGLISSEFQHKLMYAVALACEIRLKVYMEKKSQNDWVESDTTTEEETAFLIGAVGERSILDYFYIAYSLQYDVCNYLGLTLLKFYFNPLSLTIHLCCFLKLYEKAILAADLMLESPLTKNEVKYTESAFKLGPCFAHLQNLHEKLEHNKPETNTLKDTATNQNRDVADSLTVIGNSSFDIQRYEEAMDHHQKTLNIYKFITYDEEHDRNVAASLYILGSCLHKMGKYKKAMEYYEKSLDITKQIPFDKYTDIHVAASLNNIGDCLYYMGKYKQAMEYHEKSLVITKRISHDENSDRNLAGCLYNIGICLCNLGKYKEAMEHHEKSLDIVKRISLDENCDRDVTDSLNNIGICLHNIGKYEEAMEYYEKSLDITKRISPEENLNRDVADSFKHVGDCLYNIGKYNEAMGPYDNSLNMWMKLDHVARDENVTYLQQKIKDCAEQTNQKPCIVSK